ncbi:MAG: SOS response-associated peptidase [Acidobacteriota bacterium]
MCGRFVRSRTIDEIAEAFFIDIVEADLQPSFNIAPTQNLLAISGNSVKRLTAMRWGLIPSWAKDDSLAAKMINARAETIIEKPSFKTPFKNSRCLIVADGFYEWKKTGKEKIPFYIHLKSDEPFAFAGLFDHWETPEGQVLTTCTIITTEANDLMRDLHERMPVILPREQHELWLDASVKNQNVLLEMLQPFSADLMEAYEVSRLVNSPRNNSPACIKRV